MIAIYILIAILLLWGVNYCHTGFQDAYIGKEQCNAVKGIFILMVFARHIWPYMQNAGYDFLGWGDDVAMAIDRSLGQLLVVMFLFYSGYGVMESAKLKGQTYIDALPRTRILKTLLNFDIAVALFLLVDWVLVLKYDWAEMLLAFTGWTSVGNSNWYIFDILLCYIAFWFSMKHGRWWLCFVMLTLLVFVLRVSKELWWYNTLLAFPFGVLYSRYKAEIESLVHRKYIVALSLSVLLFVVTSNVSPWLFGLRANATSIAFAMTFVIITMKIRFGNPVLDWLGRNLFPLYIYQRLPMIVLSFVGGGILPREFCWLYIALCAGVTCCFAWVHQYCTHTK